MDHAAIRDLELALLASWPALEHRRLGGWILNAARGVTGRANSVTVLDPQPGPLDERIDQVERWYLDRHLVPRFRLTPLSEPELAGKLVQRGYHDRNGDTDTFVRSCANHADSAASTTAAITSGKAAPGWWTMIDRPPHEQQVIEQMLLPLGDRVAYASISGDDGLRVIGAGVLVADQVSIVNVHTRADHRGKGYARAVMQALHRWARQRGASSTFLNVLRDNTPAQALYRDFGYELAYPYRYLERDAKMIE